MSSKMYGYARVSTRLQKEDRQLAALTQFGVEKEYIVVEKQSGKDFDRPLYKGLLGKMRKRDVLVVKSIDRLGRNYEEILEQWAYLTKELGISIVVLDMPLLDTREGRDLTGTLVADIVLQLLSYVAQTERDFMRQRQAEGIEAAKARGVRFGRERIPMPAGFEGLAEDWWNGCVSATDAGKRMGVSRDTFLRRAREWGADAGYGERSLMPRDEADLEQIPQTQPEAEECECERSSEAPGADERAPQERSCAPAGDVPIGDVKITYVNHSGGKDTPAVFLFTKNEPPSFDTRKDGVSKRAFERVGCSSRTKAAFPVSAKAIASWDGGSCQTVYLAAEIGGDTAATDSTGINGDFDKDGHTMMAKNILACGRKAIFMLLPKFYWGLTSEAQEGGQFGSAALNSASFYGLDLEGLTEVTVGLYGNAKDGYKFKIDSKSLSQNY